jgi:hypothetical protein
MADTIQLRSSLQEVLPVGYPNGDSPRLLGAALLKRFQIRASAFRRTTGVLPAD